MLRRSMPRTCGPATRLTHPPAKVAKGQATVNAAGYVRPVVVTFVRHSESFNNVKHDQLKHNASHNACFELVREADPTLTDRGVLQAQLVSQRLALEDTFSDTSMILTSYMARALKTAETMQRAFRTHADHDVPVIVDRDLHEIGGHYHAEAVDLFKQRPTVHEKAALAASEKNPSSSNEGEPHSPKYRCIGSPGRTMSQVHAEFPSFEFAPAQDCTEGWWTGSGKEGVTEGQIRGARVWNILQDHALSGEHSQIVVVTHGYLYRVMMHVAKVAGLFVNPPHREFQLIQNTGITRIQLDNPELLAFGTDANEWVSDPFVPILRLRKESLRILVENDVKHVKEIGSLACRNIPVAENPAT